MKIYYENFSEDTVGNIDGDIFSAGIVTNDDGETDICWGNYHSGEREATVAWSESGRLIGLHLYDIGPEGELNSVMTWVEKRYRGKGIASELWQVSLSVSRPPFCSVFCVTDASLALVRSLSEQRPDIGWKVSWSIYESDDNFREGDFEKNMPQRALLRAA